MFSSSATLTLLFAVAGLSSAHVKMTTPAPYGASSLDNSPLKNKVDGTFTAGGTTDFPCKLRGSDTYTLPTSGFTSMPLGSTQELAFVGSAVHGGGSCQVSVSYDLEPTANSTFKVIHSIEGGCPMKNIAGNNGEDATLVDPSTYSFTIPETLPTGKATLAWTWFNKVGNREMYMNCAPIEIGSNSTTKRDQQLAERDMTAYNALPNVFVANIGDDSCGTVDSTDLLFPDPGESVEKLNGATSAFAAPTSCTGVTAAASGAGSAPAATSAPSVASAVSIAATSSTAIGGVFATQPSAAPSVAPVSSIAAPSSTLATSTTAVSASTPSGTGTTASGSAFTAGTACSTEGMWNCLGGTQFQECASGVWSAVQSVAAGTTCTSGQSMAIDIVAAATKPKRSVRFSRFYAR